MFFYLIHCLPHSADLDEKKRNVRTIFLGITLYVIIHAMLFTKYFSKHLEGKLKSVSLLKPYFYYILGADMLTMNMLYKINNGKWLFNELNFLQETRVMYLYPIFQCPLIQLVHHVHCINEVQDQHHVHIEH